MKKVTGTYDLYGSYANEFRNIENILYSISELYNFEYIKTPIIEKSSLYHRKYNNTKDNFSKHTYDFKDLSGKEITLRPEFNSGIARALFENNLDKELPKKFYYYGDVFRYDKPQKGRYREFTQFGYEIIGSKSVFADVEMLSLAYNIYKRLGINNIALKLNSLGSVDDIKKYREKLVEYFEKYISCMCDDCKKRFINNPLRILDCKNEKDQSIISYAPKLLDYITKDSLMRFEKILKCLDNRNIPYKVDRNFVRGIDYQNDTIFEIINNNHDFGTQNDLCGGGRYDNLYKHLANREISAFGFDFGLERLITSIKLENHNFFAEKHIDLFIINLDDNFEYCFALADRLRKEGIVVEYDIVNNSFKSQLEYSDRFNAMYTAFVGNNEINDNIISLRDNISNDKIILSETELKNIFKERKNRCLVK